MDSRDKLTFAASRLCALAIAVAPASIAASQGMLGATLATLIAARTRWRLPAPWPAVALFFGWTLISALAGGHPVEAWPQIRKLYVYATLAAVYTAIRSAAEMRRVLLGMAALGTVSATWGLIQFAKKYQAAANAGVPFYQAYVADRITGFMSHWMTFSAEMMIVLFVIAAWLFFGPDRKRAGLWIGAAAIVSLAIVLGFTRSIWPSTALGMIYLLWHWKRWTVALAPVIVALGMAVAPGPVQTRVLSIWKPDRTLDSNLHREALRQTGWRMIQAHPLTGVGPEQVKRRFLDYVPEEFKPVPSNWWYGHLHNIYVHFAAERGIPAVLALAAFFAWALRDFSRGLRRLPPGASYERFVLHAAVASILGILAGGWWEHNLGDSEVLMMTLAMVAGGYVSLR